VEAFFVLWHNDCNARLQPMEPKIYVFLAEALEFERSSLDKE
jgi:hypothetical protein